MGLSVAISCLLNFQSQRAYVRPTYSRFYSQPVKVIDRDHNVKYCSVFSALLQCSLLQFAWFITHTACSSSPVSLFMHIKVYLSISVLSKLHHPT